MTNMEAVQVALPVDLLKAAGVNLADASREAAMLLTLELYRENKISLGRAAELCQASVEAFMVFAGRHGWSTSEPPVGALELIAYESRKAGRIAISSCW
jgi:predicted HTH domain antitoxin